MTQERTAAESGIDYKRYQRLEQGSVNATLRTLVRVAAALRTDFWSLVAGDRHEEGPRPPLDHGLSAVHEAPRRTRTAGGAEQVAVSRLMPAEVGSVVEAFSRKRDRARWLRDVDPALAAAIEEGMSRADAVVIRGEGRARLRFDWDATEVQISIAARPDGRAMLTAKNRGFGDATLAEAGRGAWVRALDALRAYLAA